MTQYGWPQAVVYPALIVAAMTGAALCLAWGWLLAIVEVVLLALLVWALMFFRDPSRDVPQDDALLVAPADGTVTAVETVDCSDICAGPVLRIGIFLSIFNVHINRAPCRATVKTITYRQGKYLNAMNPLSGRVNESNTLVLLRAREPKDRLMIRQISGAIARRIVCTIREGQELAPGEKFGMIKFGSRTELCVPAGEKTKCLVRVGDKVKAGVTPLVRYGICQD
ncbi:MAG: phosphatidylserine decarboxylase family protein [Sedimentisphaerales bacterium]|nr:phosphatidylserine decarboxylase family protein [Sedimentisphaerales bacterium]